MTGRERALVQRPGRRVHLATLADGQWLTVCDRELPIAGTSATPHQWHDELGAERIADTCRRCLAPILAARLAVIESGPVLLAEIAELREERRGLRAQLASALDLVARYSARILATTTGTTEHAIAERRHAERVDRKLARIGR